MSLLNVSLVLFVLLSICGSAQEEEKEAQHSLSNNYVFEGNSLVNENFIEAEKKYRLAVSAKQNNAAGSYNLGNAYYKSELYDEAMLRHLEAVNNSGSKLEKHKAYHNIGNTLMQKKRCKEAVSAYKNALRNNPSDDESRYNLALAQECAKEQGDGDGEGDDEDKRQRMKIKMTKKIATKIKITKKKIKIRETTKKTKKKETTKKVKMENLRMIMEIKKIKTQTKTKGNQSLRLEKCLLNK